jgi:hypothetical protein
MSNKGYVDWSKVESRQSANGDGGERRQIEYYKFSPGKHRVRLLKQPFFYHQHFIPKEDCGTDRDIPVISPGPDEDPLVPLGYEPSEKCAVNVIDRKDGKVKIMRVGPTVYNAFIGYAQEFETNPGDLKKGPDFIINVDDPGGNPRQRKYSVMPAKVTPITKAEAESIKENGGTYDLEAIFKPTSMEKIEDLIREHGLGKKGDASFQDEEPEAGASFDDEGDEEDDEFGF